MQTTPDKTPGIYRTDMRIVRPIIYRDSADIHSEFLLLWYPQRGCYGFPATLVRNGETDTEAMLRKSVRETGLTRLVVQQEFRYAEVRDAWMKDGRMIHTAKLAYALHADYDETVHLNSRAGSPTSFEWTDYKSARAMLNRTGQLETFDAVCRKAGLDREHSDQELPQYPYT